MIKKERRFFMELVSIVISGVLLVTFIFNFIFTHVSNASRDQRSEYKEINSKIERLQNSLTEVRSEISQDQRNEYKEINNKIERLKNFVTEVRSEFRTSLTEVRSEISQIRKDIDTIKDRQSNIINTITRNHTMEEFGRNISRSVQLEIGGSLSKNSDKLHQLQKILSDDDSNNNDES